MMLPSVHPRVCRERCISDRIDLATIGSSPRVQGTLNLNSIHPNPIRFIPACAGNAAEVQAVVEFLSVHPRVCRERPNMLRANLRRPQDVVD